MKRTVVLSALAAFVALDVVLVALALRRSEPVPALAALAPPAAQVVTGAATDLDPRRVLLSVSADGSVVRADQGSCVGGEASSVTVAAPDGAITDVPWSPGQGQVLRVSTPEPGVWSLIVADQDCAVRRLESRDGGASWSSAPALGQWYRDPRRGDVVHGPHGDVEPGCTVQQVHPLDLMTARVGCRDGRLRGTDDAGATWVDLGRAPGPGAVAYVSSTEAVAVAATTACPAQTYASVDGGALWSERGCVDAFGIEGLTVDGTALVAQVGGELWRSRDAGLTWSAWPTA